MKDLRNYLKPQEIEALLDKAAKLRDYLVVRILWKTGMRVSELCAMEVSWIDFEERMITVFGKGKKWRRIPVDRETIILLKNYIGDLKIEKRIFKISRIRVYQILQELCHIAGIKKKIHPHTLRHSYAVNYLKNGGNLRNLQLNLGHVKLDTTAVYLQFTSEDRKEEYDKIMSN